MILRAGTTRPAFHCRWWRTCVAWCALVALAWPSLGPLPYVVHDVGAHFAAGTVQAHADGDGDDHHVDGSSIPGSPTHPDDHDCPECVVLKHLSRCMLPVLAIGVCAPVVVAVVTRRIAFSRPPAPVPAYVPPARGPPLAIA